LIPVTDDIVKKINLKEESIEIDPLNGMFDD